MKSLRSRSECGFTLLEIVVVLVILGILLAIAVPRYLGFRRNALVSEADSFLQELKTLAWAYYHQHQTWVGITTANMSGVLGVEVPPPTACWSYSVLGTATATQIQFQAAGAGSLGKCLPASGATVTLVLNSDGSSSRTQAFP